MSVAILDYGVGNVGSVENMFRRLGVQVECITSAEQLDSAERVLLPGVGAFDAAMRELDTRGLVAPIRDYAVSGRPLLGICLGMQMLLDGSDEGTRPGLGLIPGRSVKFDTTFTAGGRIPHMGWNSVHIDGRSDVVDHIGGDDRFYFVHSYRAAPSSSGNIIGRTRYGHEFASVIGRDNVLGVQFHPEKSHKFGASLLRRFAEL